MRKYQVLAKKTGIEAAIAVGVMAASVTLMIVVSGVLESATQKQATLQGEVAGIQSEIAQTRERIQSTGASTKIYDELKSARHTMALEVNRKAATETLGRLKDQFRLSSLNLQLSPDQPLESDRLKTAGITAVKSNVDITLGAMSDQHLFSFIQELSRSFSGFVKLREITITRSKAFDIDSMREISRGSKPEMVTGKLAFEWYGIPHQEAK